MSVQRIATRYAKSLLDLAVERGNVEEVFQDVQVFNEALKNRDFYLALKSPIISGPKKVSILNALFGESFSELTIAFLKILVKKGREPYIPDITREFNSQYKKMKHISSVRITTAQPLSESALNDILEKLKASSSTDQEVEIDTHVDPKLIGGFIIQFDDKIFDASVHTKLEELRKEFKDNLYISQIIAS